MRRGAAEPAGLAAALALLALLAALPTGPARAQPADAGPSRTRALPAAIDAQLQLEQRLLDIGWRLVRGNAPFCANAQPRIGLQLHDMASYREPDELRALFGLRGDFAVLAAAQGSPASRAGLASGDEIVAIDGARPGQWPARAHSDWRRTWRAHELIARQLAAHGTITLELAGGRKLRIAGTPACPSRFELGGKGRRAVADGHRVIVERDFPGLAYGEDELAAALAHELAHNLLGHRAWLAREGRKRRNVRLTEREADRLMPWLLANAGYDPEAAVRFMQRWGPRHSGGILRARSHDGWDERVEFISGELAQVARLRAEHGRADWQRHFRREIAP